MSEPLLYGVATWVIVLGLFVGLNLAWLGFFRLGRREAARRGKSDADLGPLEASMGGLVALILAFSFSLAAQRHDEREHVIVREANAIGTAFLRCDLLGAFGSQLLSRPVAGVHAGPHRVLRGWP